jgi:hypothetical protein
MALLCYCVVRDDAPVVLPATGNGERPVQTVSVPPLVAVASPLPPGFAFAAATAVSDALEFHRVVESIFCQTDLIPFRFPTLQEEAGLREHLWAKRARYEEWLRRFRGLVQMEVRVPAEKAAEERDTAISGTEYLRGRQAQLRRLESLAERVRTAVGPLATDWRQRVSASGVRAYALTSRGAVEAFAVKAGRVLAEPGCAARVGGPWPPTEFMGEL